MKHIKNIIFPLFALILISLTACEKVIDVQLEETEKSVVVYAKLYNGVNDFIVVVNKTISFFNDAELESIDNATITLSSLGGVNETMIAFGEGFYGLPGFDAQVGETYTLDITADGETYSATTTMPAVPIIDTTYTVFDSIGNFAQDPGYDVFNAIQDVAGENAYYRIWYSLNDTLRNGLNDFIIFDDEFIVEGEIFDIPLFADRFQPGDRVGMILANMEEPVYRHYETLFNLVQDQGGGNSAAPANPTTNFNNGALGVFGAFATTTAYIEVVE